MTSAGGGGTHSDEVREVGGETMKTGRRGKQSRKMTMLRATDDNTLMKTTSRLNQKQYELRSDSHITYKRICHFSFQ